MAADSTGPSLRETSRLLVRIAEAALAIAGVAFLVLVVSSAGLVGQLSALDPSQVDRTEPGADGEEAAPPRIVVDGAAQTALSVATWSLPIALLAGIGAALTAHRAAELTEAETSRRLGHLRRPGR